MRRTVKPSAWWSKVTRLHSWWAIHMPRPPAGALAAGSNPANGSVGPVPWSVTVTTIRSGADHTRSLVGGSPWHWALVTVSLTAMTKSATSASVSRVIEAAPSTARRAADAVGSTRWIAGGMFPVDPRALIAVERGTPPGRCNVR